VTSSVNAMLNRNITSPQWDGRAAIFESSAPQVHRVWKKTLLSFLDLLVCFRGLRILYHDLLSNISNQGVSRFELQTNAG
jgi:hypothetical protein